MKELSKQEFFEKLKQSFESGNIDSRIKLIARESIWYSWCEIPTIEMNTKSIDYIFSQDSGIITFIFPSCGLEIELKVSVYDKTFLNLETRDRIVLIVDSTMRN